jgi:hypothetical protein
VKALALVRSFHYITVVSKVQEIESALQQLPSEQQWEVAHWLLDRLEVTTDSTAAPKAKSTPTLPNYAARRRRIFGDKVLPNMVLAARSEERW